MDLSIFFAQFWGIYMLFMGVAMFIRKEMLREVVDGLENNRPLMLFMGVLVFMLGIIFVLLHNVWETSWRVVITLFAWATLIKGAQYVLTPEWLLRKARFFTQSTNAQYVATAVVIAVGAYLTYMGFLA